MPPPDVVLTREWGPVRGYDPHVPPTVGDLAVFSVSKEIRGSAGDMVPGTSSPDDLLRLMRERAWTKAVDQPILPDGWAILRGVDDPEVRLDELAAPEASYRQWRIVVSMLWLARYVGR